METQTLERFDQMDDANFIHLGVSCFFAGFQHDDPNSFNHDDHFSRSGSSWAAFQIMGKFRTIVSLRHENLCGYVDIIRGKHERLMIVAEYHTTNLTDTSLRHDLRCDRGLMLRMTRDVLGGLEYLNQHDVPPECLTPEMIVYDKEKNVFKISEFATAHIRGFGNYALHRFMNVRYLAPELLTIGAKAHATALQAAVLPSSAVWSLGVVIAEIFEVLNFSKMSVADWVASVLESMEKKHSAFSEALLLPGALSTGVPSDFRHFLTEATVFSASSRPGPHTITKKLNDLFGAEEPRIPRPYDPLWDVFPSVELRCRSELPRNSKSLKIPLSTRSVDEIYRLWKLAGGDVLLELRAHGYAAEEASILALPQLVAGDQVSFAKGHYLMGDPAGRLISLNLQTLLDAVDDVAKEVYFPLLMRSEDAIQYVAGYEEMRDLPLVIRENNLKYQLHVQILYHRLLSCYPFTHAAIKREAAADIPPLYRSRTWAALLGVKGNIVEQYNEIDKDSPCSSDRQIEVDIPRCHQYNPLMSSLEAHLKLKRILKAWIAGHPQFVYWQGLDSLSAPFVFLNFSDEPLAYACLSAFVEKYVHRFFLKDNTPVIHEYLAVFSHLLAFHDPVLATHLSGIGFLPELYSIPWFLTMFTHVFPLHKIFHLWDQLLLGDESFPLFIGLSLLTQLRSQLLDCGFNECILLFSDFPDLGIQQCLTRAKEMFSVTPKSATYRMYATCRNTVPVIRKETDGDSVSESDNTTSPEGVHVLDLETLKSETCPRITWEEIQWLNHSSRNHSSKRKSVRPVLVDVRTSDEFYRGTLAHSINIPFLTAFNADGDLLPTFEGRTLEDSRGKLVVVFDGKCNIAPKFAAELVRLGFPRVCVLHQGMDPMKTSGFVSVPPSV